MSSGEVEALIYQVVWLIGGIVLLALGEPSTALTLFVGAGLIQVLTSTPKDETPND